MDWRQQIIECFYHFSKKPMSYVRFVIMYIQLGLYWITLGSFYEAVFYSVLLIIKGVRITRNKELKVSASERTISWARLGKVMYQAPVA
jgi:hypothetical protein